MKTPIIVLSKPYKKMPRGYKQTRILQIFAAYKDALTEDFLIYNTIRRDGTLEQIDSDYLLVLVLLSKNKLWTHLLPWNEHREGYYKGFLDKYVRVRVRRQT